MHVLSISARPVRAHHYVMPAAIRLTELEATLKEDRAIAFLISDAQRLCAAGDLLALASVLRCLATLQDDIIAQRQDYVDRLREGADVIRAS